VEKVPETGPSYTQVTVRFAIVDDATFTVLVPADTDSDGVYDRFDVNEDGDFDDTGELDNCSDVSNPDQEDADSDGAGDACDDGDSDNDGFTDRQESYVGTSPADACSNPLDIDGDGVLSVTGDVFNYVGRIGARPGPSNWWQRLDLDMSGDISVTGDVAMYIGRIGETCR